MNKYKVVAICGKSAAGKDTFLQVILQQPNNNFHEIISHTTRPPREGEINGKNYWFVDTESFNTYEKQGLMLETTAFRDWRYGACTMALNPNAINVGVFNVVGLKSLLSNKNVEAYVVFVDTSDKIRLLRSLRRETNPDIAEIIRRYHADEEDFKDFETIHVDLTVLNITDELEDLIAPAQEVLHKVNSFWAREAN